MWAGLIMMAIPVLQFFAGALQANQVLTSAEFWSGVVVVILRAITERPVALK